MQAYLLEMKDYLRYTYGDEKNLKKNITAAETRTSHSVLAYSKTTIHNTRCIQIKI